MPNHSIPLVLGKFQINVFRVGEIIKSTVISPYNDLGFTSSIIGLSVKDFCGYLFGNANILQRFLQIDEKSLRIAYIRGLPGGGPCLSKNKPKTSHQIPSVTESKERKVGPDKSSPVFNLNPTSINQPLPVEQRNPEPKTNIYEENLLIGRENEIDTIGKYLVDHNIVVLTGRGGIGKTSVAVKYYQAKKSLFKIAWQINSESQDTLLLDLSTLGGVLGIETEKKPQFLNKLRVKLDEFQDSILIIFDNAKNQSQIDKYLTKNPKVKYIVTSRSEEWSEKILIKQLNIEDSINLLQTRIGDSHNKEEIKELIEKVEGWPIAILASSSHIVENGYQVKAFLNYILGALGKDEKIQKILKSQFSNITGNTESILEILSVCEPRKIPESLIKTLFLFEQKDEDWINSRELLLNSHIVSFQDGFWRIGSLTYDFIQKNYKLTKTDALIDYYNKEFIIGADVMADKTKVDHIVALQPHVEVFINSIKVTSIKEISILYYLVHFYTEIIINSKSASENLDKILACTSTPTITKKEDLGALYLKLANLFTLTCDYSRSEDFYQRALTLYESLLPRNHPHLASLYTNMGVLYKSKQAYPKSEEFYLRSLKIRESLLPANHKDLATLYMNLGNLYRTTGDYSRTESFYLKSLKIREEILPSNHPDRATLYLNLGILHWNKAEYKKSEEFYLKALRIREVLLPDNHYSLANICMNLGVLYCDLKEFKKSEEFYMRCLKIREGILPPGHAEIADIYMNLGNMYGDMMRVQESEVCYQKALKIQEGNSNSNQTDIASLYMNIGVMYHDTRNYSKCEEFYLKASKIREEVLPENHPELAVSYVNLGVLYGTISNYEKSEEFHLKALKIRERILHSEHPALARAYLNLGELYYVRKEYDQSQEFYMKGLKIRERILPEGNIKIEDVQLKLKAISEARQKV